MFDRIEALKKLMEEIEGYASEGMASERKSRYAEPPEGEGAGEAKLEVTKIEAKPEGAEGEEGEASEALIKDMEKDGDSALESPEGAMPEGGDMPEGELSPEILEMLKQAMGGEG
jgi:hypothetical protein